MMQNNPMGAMMPQGVAPAASTSLNFQSDPSMRAQFKGFMSGMQAKQPAPAAPMLHRSAANSQSHVCGHRSPGRARASKAAQVNSFCGPRAARQWFTA